MATKVVCPDCGGIIGDTSPGESPCTCFTPPPETTSKSDTATLDAVTRTEKVCVLCGRDVAGHRRLKDSRGYICLSCAKAEKAAEKAGKIRCKLCRKLVKPDGLVPLNGKMVCRMCNADFQEKAKFTRKINVEQYEKHETRNLIILGTIFCILAAIVIYSQFFKGH